MWIRNARRWVWSALSLTLLPSVLAIGFPADVGAAEKLYFTEWSPQKLRRCNTDGTSAEDLLNNPGYIATLLIDHANGKLYWGDWGTHEIRRADLDGGNLQTILTTAQGLPQALALDLTGGYLYWVDGGLISTNFRKTFQRSRLDGSNIETLFTMDATFTEDMTVDAANGHLYWVDQWSPSKIRRANLDGSDVRTLVAIPQGVAWRLAIDFTAAKMYWTVSQPGKIQRANLDGSGVEDVLTTGSWRPNDIAIDRDAGLMYWTELDPDAIRRARLDGTHVETVFTPGPTDPSVREIVLDSAPGAVALELKGVPNPVIAGEPFDLRLKLDSSRADFVATFTLRWLAGTETGVLWSTSGIPLGAGTRFVDFPVLALDQFPPGLPPAVAFLATLVDEASGEIVAVDTERVRIKP